MQYNHPSWVTEDGGISRGTGCPALKPGQSREARTSWSLHHCVFQAPHFSGLPAPTPMVPLSSVHWGSLILGVRAKASYRRRPPRNQGLQSSGIGRKYSRESLCRKLLPTLKQWVAPVNLSGHNDDTGDGMSLTRSRVHNVQRKLVPQLHEDRRRGDAGIAEPWKSGLPGLPSSHPNQPRRGGHHSPHFTNEETQTQREEVTCPGHVAGVRGRIRTQDRSLSLHGYPHGLLEGGRGWETQFRIQAEIHSLNSQPFPNKCRNMEPLWLLAPKCLLSNERTLSWKEGRTGWGWEICQ